MSCKTKRRYPTPVDAMLAIERIQRQRNLESVENHERCWYQCGDHYHVTSWTTEEGP